MADRPRLLIITPDFPPAPGGIQVMAHRLAAGMSRFETKVVALDCDGAARFDGEGRLSVRRVAANGAPRAARNALLNAVALREALRRPPDVTLSLHIVGSLGAAVVRRLLGAPTVQYFHAKEISARPKLSAFAAEHADVVIAVSAYCAELIAATGAAPEDMRRIPPGVDIPADPTSERAERPTIITIARLEDRYKGHDVMVQALALVRAKVPDVQWVLVGDGSLRAELEQQVRQQGISDSVSFLGAVSDEERDRWLRRADLLAMPSRLPGGGLAGDGFGIVFLEAAAYGKPVVAGNVGGALDSVSDGENGLLVDPRDPGAVADAIGRLLLDRELAARLGSAGAARARSFAWPVIAERVEEVLLEQRARSLPHGARWRGQAGRSRRAST
jgi:phosphatidylinositol alpha-1,6-mannosyltransferase